MNIHLLITTLIVSLTKVFFLTGIIFLGKNGGVNEENPDSQGNAGSEQMQHSEMVMNTQEDSETEQVEETEIVLEPAVEDVTMFFTGDVMLQYCKGIYDEKGINGLVTEYIQQEMVNADMTMINNEFPFSLLSLIITIPGSP